MIRSATTSAVTLALLATLAAGCAAPPPPPEPPPSQRVENPELGIALAAVPEGFRLTGSDAQGIHLERVGELAGTARVTAGPVLEGGLNLYDEVNRQKAALEARPNGSFLGQVEIMGPTGNAFSTRGRYTEGGTAMEEIRILGLHPTENRLLSVSYVYAAGGDSKERVEHAFAVLGEVEAARAEPEGGNTAAEGG
jgi:hypothetical protein